MKTLVESINASINEGASVQSVITWDLKNLQDMKPAELKNELEELCDGNGKDIKFYTDLIKLVNKNKGRIFTSDEGNLYYEEYGYDSLAAMLIDYGIAKEGNWGFVLNQDGDDGMSTFCVFDKEPNKNDWKKIDAMIGELSINGWVHIAETFENASVRKVDDEEIRRVALQDIEGNYDCENDDYFDYEDDIVREICDDLGINPDNEDNFNQVTNIAQDVWNELA